MKELFTEAGTRLPSMPWHTYPRPQMVRHDWLCLNGDWELSSGNVTRIIRVPFCPESLLSGIHETLRYGEMLIYRKIVTIPESWRNCRILLHFGAVSRSTRVFWNGHEVVRSEQAYLPFTAEVTNLLRKGENELRVEAVNDLSPRYPWGKQKENRGGMWYTPVSGIWQTVWMEPVPERFASGIHIEANDRSALVRLIGEHVPENGQILCGDRRYPLTDGQVEIVPEEPRLWSPEDPFLYPITVEAGEDRFESYFALRRLSIESVDGKPRLCLNGKPYFFHGLLDQGYWSDGLYTPPDAESYDRDILALKELGFNTLRKHIKVEPEVFYCACDRLGMAVFQDMVNAGTYSFFTDTLLPTLGMTHLPDRCRHRDPETRANFLEAMEATVELLGNHPCLCAWTVFNEGWGQFCADEAYSRLKKADPSRFIDTTSGWFGQKKSDVESLHVYFRSPHLGSNRNKPQIISEFGGYVFAVPEHTFNPGKSYGYGAYRTREDWVQALRRIYLEQLLPLIPQGLCASIYTQVSDVEDEVNGLFTFDRRVNKLKADEFADVSRRIKGALNSSAGDV